MLSESLEGVLSESLWREGVPSESLWMMRQWIDRTLMNEKPTFEY